jgi:hypothetical protein
MQVATIVPIAHLDEIRGEPYHMALAHIAGRSPRYRDFYRAEVDRGAFLLLDNGVVETGIPWLASAIYGMALHLNATEMILPDYIGDMRGTLQASFRGLSYIVQQRKRVRAMAVPQGRTVAEWSHCAKMMSGWPVDSFGISKFARFPGEGYERLDLLRTEGGQAILEGSNLMTEEPFGIHLLGCAQNPFEITFARLAFPGRIRGVDSGVAAIATMHGATLRTTGERLPGPLDLEKALDPELLRQNLEIWRRATQAGCASEQLVETVQAWQRITAAGKE